MIPKIIHYCWYGGNEMNDVAKKCIESWKNYCPDYKFICWDETNTDFEMNDYLKEAYESKKYAFITDYIRLYALKLYGGFYMDTDVELLKPLDELCKDSAFTGVQEENVCVTGIIGAEPNNPWIECLIHYYDDRHFFKEDGTLDLVPNTVFITNYTKKKYGWTFSHQIFEVPNTLTIYPFDYLCCKDYETGYIFQTINSIAIHHFNGSWVDKGTGKVSYNTRIKRILIKLLGYKKYRSILYSLRKKRYGDE